MGIEWLNWDYWASLLQAHALWLMFFSAFLSATVLPGNSEWIFMGLAAALLREEADYFSLSLLKLIVVAGVGNSLGSLTTYAIGRLFPPPSIKEQDKKSTWVLRQFQRFGSPFLLLSWLPVIGDVCCAVAGWLRLSFWQSAGYIFLGKTLRYVFLVFLIGGVFR